MEETTVHQEIEPEWEEARIVGLENLDYIDTFSLAARRALMEGSLYKSEAAFQRISMFGGISSEQLLRVITETGELRAAGMRREDQRSDEVRVQRESHDAWREEQRDR